MTAAPAHCDAPLDCGIAVLYCDRAPRHSGDHHADVTWTNT